MSAIVTLAIKDLRLLLRDKFALFWILAFPLMFALFFGSLFNDGGGGGGGLSLTVVDEDQSDASRGLVRRLAAHESLRLVRTGDGEDAPLEALGLDAAREAVQKGRRTAYLRIPAGFGDNPYAVFGGGDEQAALEIGIDPGRQAEAGFLQGILMESIFGALQDRIMDKQAVSGDIAAAQQEVAAAEDLGGAQKFVLESFLGALGLFVEQIDMQDLQGGGTAGAGGEASSGGGFGQPLEVVDVSRDTAGNPRSAFDVSFPQALVWGLMSVSLGFAITLVRERTAGTLLRLRMAPISRAQLLAGKALGCYLACLMTMLVLLAFSALALGVRFDSLPLLGLAMLSVAACFTGIMMTVSVMGKTEAAVAGSSWGLLMPFAMIGGGMIPLIAMPGWLIKVSVISPFRWAIMAVEGAVWRDYGLGDMALPCAVLVGTGALFFVLGVTVFRRVSA